MPEDQAPDPWFKRSAFGSFLFVGGAIGIGYLYGRIPEEHDLLELLGLLLTVFGYTVVRPTAKVPRA